MKKRYRIALAACMTAAALTACQGKAAEPDASAAVSEKTDTGASETKKRNRWEGEQRSVRVLYSPGFRRKPVRRDHI